jgi:hypothetical protein
MDGTSPNSLFKKGKPTGQVFFSGGSSGATHTWITINDVAYDSLFGTIDTEVPGVEDEQFTLHPTKPDRWIGKKTGRILIKDKKLKNSGAAMGFSSYKLED